MKLTSTNPAHEGDICYYITPRGRHYIEFSWQTLIWKVQGKRRFDDVNLYMHKRANGDDIEVAAGEQ